MKQYIYLSVFFLVCFSLQLNAQMKKVTDVASLQKKMEQTASSIKSIESDFTQVKHMDIFNEDITSKGKFYYKNDNKICLDYSQPTNYLIVINNEKIKIVSNGKKNVMNLKSNKVMKEMRGMLTACMSGNISNISTDYKMDFFEDSQNYLVKVKPMNKNVQDYLSGFEIYMDKKDFSVSKLRIFETVKDYTDYVFKNKKFNTLNDDKIFSVL